jgi:glycine cleavage system H protein
MNVPAEARFVKSHEYVLPEAGSVLVGISEYAASQLGDVVFVELPPVGTKLKKGASFGVVESVKAVSDLYAPIDGEVVAINDALNTEPALVNEDAYGRGWMLRVKPSDDSQLSGADFMDPAAYTAFTGEH